MFAVLHIPDFALHAVLRTEPGMALQPAALFANRSKKSLLLAANPAARACGIHEGMTAPQAMARCPTLVIRSPVEEASTEARAALLATGFTLSPSIEDTAPGICTIDLKGSLSDPAPLAAAAVNQLLALGLPATAGIARTPLLALYAARATKPATLARETSAVLTVKNEQAFLAPLPLSAADPPAELASILTAWGIRTLGDLIALPREEIGRRFGSTGLALWIRAAGGEPRPLHPVAPAQRFLAAMTFEEEIETLEPLLFILRRFIDRLALELRAAQLVAIELNLQLQLVNDTRYARNFRLPEPTADEEILFRTLHTHLETLQTAEAIIALELQLTPTRPLVRQPGLFETGLRDPHGFAETLARVAALMNTDEVGTPQSEDTHRPDAFRLVTPATVVPAPAQPPVHPPLGLPLRRFRPPLRATLLFSPHERKPTYVHTTHFEGTITSLHGPWRSSGDWWQTDRAWSRLEWDIALAEGGLYRLLQINDTYYIEGEYD